ncbi:MAG: prepilin-type N-terminal cleavage/methylation domain-containing protein [Candidatus Omnitrophica bacterium]|nr:prepilin-type N-terminal cleavage/methylation domain-containing protein [Candidatus Omnitrophota bacterium]
MVKKFNKQGITLAELLIATTLIGVVMLGIIGFDISMRRFGVTTQTSATLKIEAMTIAARISKDALETQGNVGESPTIVASANQISFQKDASVSKWVVYRYDASGSTKNTICRFDNSATQNPANCAVAGAEILSKKVVTASLQWTGCKIRIDLTLQADPTQVIDATHPWDPIKNPRAAINMSSYPEAQSCS